MTATMELPNRQRRRAGFWLPVAGGVLAAALTAASPAGLGVFAIWTDSHNFNHDVQDGNLDLAGSAAALTNFPQSGENMAPGDSGFRYLQLSNAGDLSMDNIVLTAAPTINSDSVAPTATSGQVGTEFTGTLDYCSSGYVHTSSTSATCAGSWTSIAVATDISTYGTGVAMPAAVETLLASPGGTAGLRVTLAMKTTATDDLEGTNFSLAWTVNADQRPGQTGK